MVTPNPADTYAAPTYRNLYEAYFQELAAEALIRRWQTVGSSLSILVAATASGSAIAGWPLWNVPWGKWVWSVIAGTASLAALILDRLRISEQLKEWDELRRQFSELRFDLETLWIDLGTGALTAPQAKQRYDALRKSARELLSKTPSPFLLTKGLRDRVQGDLNETLKAKGYAS